jgi:YD repeat-containing protein
LRGKLPNEPNCQDALHFQQLTGKLRNELGPLALFLDREWEGPECRRAASGITGKLPEAEDEGQRLFAGTRAGAWTDQLYGYYTTATDQAGNARVTQTDALGRVTAVWENPGGWNYETTYGYDALGDLVQVNQGSETRTFSYDGLGRLTKSVQPESGTTTYSYDAVGNVKTKTDARSITTSYSYDAVNRVTQKSYSDGTPAASYGYDASGAGYSWGHLTSASNANTTTTYNSIDPLGHVTASTQQTGNGSYGFTYYYNRGGALYYETYPSGRGVTTSYDGANRAAGVAGSYHGGGTNYLANVWYWPHDAVCKETYANQNTHTYTFNSRLQMNGSWDAVYDNPNDFLFLENGMNYGGTTNNGNLLGVTFYGMTPYTETFTYDALNRLSSASDTGGMVEELWLRSVRQWMGEREPRADRHRLRASDSGLERVHHEEPDFDVILRCGRGHDGAAAGHDVYV